MPILPRTLSQHSAAPAPRSWPRSLFDGAVAAFAGVAVVLTLGVLAFAPLGLGAAALGVPAAFLTVVVSAAVLAAFSRCALPIGGPSSATALIFASLLAQLVADPALQNQPVSAFLVPLGTTVVLMGVVQCAMALAGLASLARFVPQPVLAGFMNGVALLILIGQLPALLAVAPMDWQQRGLQAASLVSGGALALGLGTAACIWVLAWRAPRAPAALLGLLAGVLVYDLAQAWGPAWAPSLGPTLGALPAGWPAWGALALFENTTGLATIWRHLPSIVLTAVMLALISTLESMLALRALDQQVSHRHNGKRELTVLGLANIAGGLFGALPTVHLRARALVIVNLGNLGSRPAFGAALASALLLWWGGLLIAHLPSAVLAGVMVTVAFSLIDRWSRELLGQQLRGVSTASARASLGIVATVAVLTVWLGPPLGVAAGTVLATLVFVRSMNRSLLRSRYTAQAQPSRRIYPPALEATLLPLRQHITVLELEGALFFGNAERVADVAQSLPLGCKSLVLDLRRVSAIDESGAMMLQQLDLRLARQAVRLLLAGVTPDSAHQRALTAFGAAGPAGTMTWFFDADQAVEAAERRLLDAAHPGINTTGSAVTLAQCSLLRGLSPEQQAIVSSHLQRYVLQPGERLFDEGDPDNGLYVLTSGSVSVRSAQGQRLVSFSPGTMLGEMAMLDGQQRSAAAYADSQSEVSLLSKTEFEILARADPVLCTLLYRNIGVHLTERLRAASNAWRSAAG